MTEQHFQSANEVREFLNDVADQYRKDADEYGTYEAATAIFSDYSLCPWSITNYFESSVPYDELSGPDPRDMIEHEAVLCIEEILDEIYYD